MRVRQGMTTAFMAGGLMIAAAAAVHAAPDNTLGMALMSASVNGDGTLARGSGATSASKLGTGEYEVFFERDLSTCTWVVSPGTNTSGGAVTAVFAEADPRAGNSEAIFVSLRDSAAATADKPFHLLVFCPE